MGRWVAGPQTRTPPRTPNARRTSMSWSASGATPARGPAGSCAGTAARSRVQARTSRSRRRLHARAHARAAHPLARSVLWQMLVSGLRGGVLPGLGVTAAPGLGLCWMHTCTALAALLHHAPLPCPPTAAGLHSVSRLVHTQPVHKMRRGAGETPPPGWASGWVPARQTDRCWRARSTTKCVQKWQSECHVGNACVARVMLRSPWQSTVRTVTGR